MTTILRLHGKETRVLVQIGGVGTQYMLGTLNVVDVPHTTDRAEVTSFGDGNKVSLKGYADGDFTMSGFYDANDTVMAAAKAATSPSYWWVYPYYSTDKTRYYWAPGDVEWGYHSEVNGPQTVTNGHVFATGTVIDSL